MTHAGGAKGRPGRGQKREPWRSARLHVVSGKGGAGKTTVAAALAIAMATGGRRVLIVEVEERQGLAQVFDTKPLSYEEQHVATAPGGGDVFGLAVDPHEALMEYLTLFHHMKRAGKTLERIGAVDFATTVAPGLRDVLLTGKIFEAVARRVPPNDSFAYDAVVLDAPPTGRLGKFLNVSTDVVKLAKIGPTIHRQAEAITRLFHSPRTAVHLVTLLEEMPVQETVEAVNALERHSLPMGWVLINETRRPSLPNREIVALREGEVDIDAITKELASFGIHDNDLARILLAEGTDYVERVVVERRARRLLRQLDNPTFELPSLGSGVDVAGLYELARSLRRQGAA